MRKDGEETGSQSLSCIAERLQALRLRKGAVADNGEARSSSQIPTVELRESEPPSPFSQRLAMLKAKKLGESPNDARKKNTHRKKDEAMLQPAEKLTSFETAMVREPIMKGLREQQIEEAGREIAELKSQLMRIEVAASLENIIRCLELDETGTRKKALRRLAYQMVGNSLELAFEGWGNLLRRNAPHCRDVHPSEQQKLVLDADVNPGPPCQPYFASRTSLQGESEVMRKRVRVQAQSAVFSAWNEWKGEMRKRRDHRLVYIKMSLERERRVVTAVWISLDQARGLKKTYALVRKQRDHNAFKWAWTRWGNDHAIAKACANSAEEMHARYIRIGQESGSPVPFAAKKLID